MTDQELKQYCGAVTVPDRECAMGDRLSGLHTDSNGVFLCNFIYKLEWAFCN